MSAIEIRNVAKSYGALEVMRDISMQIESGEFVVFVGPSGCGKVHAAADDRRSGRNHRR